MMLPVALGVAALVLLARKKRSSAAHETVGASAAVDQLLAAMRAKVDNGEEWLGMGGWTATMTALGIFKEAGAIGLRLGPMLDIETNDRSKPMTHDAWLTIAQLAHADSGFAGQHLVRKALSDYEQGAALIA